MSLFKRTPKRVTVVTVGLYYDETGTPLVYLQGKAADSPEVQFVTRWMQASAKYVREHSNASVEDEAS